LALALALLAGIAPSATAQVSGASQEAPSTTWVQPGADPLDGLGAWVYIAPEGPPAPTQGSPGGYEYLLRFNLQPPSPQAFGFIGLSTRPDGSHFAGLVMVSSVPQPTDRVDFAWAPGQFYYLLVYQVGVSEWVGWVYDYSAASWTIVGQVTAPEGSGRLSPTSATTVDYQSGGGSSGLGCFGYPRTDVFFYPPVGYRGSTVSLATLGSHSVSPGDCPTTTSVEYDWVHYRLGADPAPAAAAA
jgi:hypothetical protein